MSSDIFGPEAWREPDRHEGLLTKKGREFLLDERNLNKRAEWGERRQVEARLVHGLLDIVLLSETLMNVDLGEPMDYDYVPERKVGVALIGFAYTCLYSHEHSTSTELEEWLEEATDIYQPLPYEGGDSLFEFVEKDIKPNIEVEESKTDVMGIFPDEVTENLSEEELEERLPVAYKQFIEEECKLAHY
jgi:hypothetical protein